MGSFGVPGGGSRRGEEPQEHGWGRSASYRAARRHPIGFFWQLFGVCSKRITETTWPRCRGRHRRQASPGGFGGRRWLLPKRGGTARSYKSRSIPFRLDPTALEEELVRAVPGRQPALLPRPDAARHGWPPAHQAQLPRRQDRSRVPRRATTPGPKTLCPQNLLSPKLLVPNPHVAKLRVPVFMSPNPVSSPSPHVPQTLASPKPSCPHTLCPQSPVSPNLVVPKTFCP